MHQRYVPCQNSKCISFKWKVDLSWSIKEDFAYKLGYLNETARIVPKAQYKYYILRYVNKQKESITQLERQTKSLLHK